MSKNTVLITGASTGFGYATAGLLADKSWNQREARRTGP